MADTDPMDTLGVGLNVTIKAVADERSAKAAGAKIAETATQEALRILGETAGGSKASSSVARLRAMKVKLAAVSQELTKEQEGLIVDTVRVLEEATRALNDLSKAKGKKPRLIGDNVTAIEQALKVVENLLTSTMSGTSKDLVMFAEQFNQLVAPLSQLRKVLAVAPKGMSVSIKNAVNGALDSFKAIEGLTNQMVSAFSGVAAIKIGRRDTTNLTQNLGVQLNAKLQNASKIADNSIRNYLVHAEESAIERIQAIEQLIANHISEATRQRLDQFKLPSSSAFLEKAKRYATTFGSKMHMDFEFAGDEILSATVGNLTSSVTFINDSFREIIKASGSEFLESTVKPGISRQLEQGSRGLHIVEVLEARDLANRLIDEIQQIELTGESIGTWARNFAEKPVLEGFTAKYAPTRSGDVKGLFDRNVIVDVMDLFAKVTGLKGFKGQSLASAFMLLFKAEIAGHHTSNNDTMYGSLIETVIRSPELLKEALDLTPAQKQDFVTFVLKESLGKVVSAVKDADFASLAKQHRMGKEKNPTVIINSALAATTKSLENLTLGIEDGTILGGFGDIRAIERIIARHDKKPLPKLEKSIAAASVKVEDAFGHMIDVYATRMYEAITSDTRGMSAAKIISKMAGPTEDFFSQVRLGYQGKASVDVHGGVERVLSLVGDAAYAVSELTKIDGSGTIDLRNEDIRASVQQLPLIWKEAVTRVTAELLGPGKFKFDPTHVSLPATMPFTAWMSEQAEAKAFFGSDSERNKGLKILSELVSRDVPAFDIARFLRDELKITQLIPKGAKLDDFVESAGYAKRGLEWEPQAIELLKAAGWKILEHAGKVEQETSFGPYKGHPDVVGWHQDYGTNILDLKYYGQRNMDILNRGATPTGAAYQLGAYASTLTPEALQQLSGVGVVTPVVHPLTGEITNVTVHLRELDAAIMAEIATRLAAVGGFNVATAANKEFSQRVINFAATAQPGLTIAPSSTFKPEDLLHSTLSIASNALFTKYVQPKAVFANAAAPVGSIDELIRDIARVQAGEPTANRGNQQAIDQVSVLAIQLGISLEQLVSTVIDAKAALGRGLSDVQKAEGFNKEFSARLIDKVAPSAEASHYVSQKLLDYKSAVSGMQAESEAARQYRLGRRGGEPGTTTVVEERSRGFETAYSAEIANITTTEHVYGKSFETLQSRAEAARKEINRVVALMSKSVGSEFLSGPEKQFNEFTKEMQQLIAQVEYFDQRAMSQTNKSVEWGAAASAANKELADRSLTKKERKKLELARDDALINKQRSQLRASSIQEKADELRGSLIDLAKTTDYKQWSEMPATTQQRIRSDENIALAMKDAEAAKEAVQRKLVEDYVKIRARLYVEPDSIEAVQAAVKQATAAAKEGVKGFSANELLTRISGLDVEGPGLSSSMKGVLQAEALTNLKGDSSLSSVTAARDAMVKTIKAMQVELATLGSTTSISVLGAEAKSLDERFQKAAATVKLLDVELQKIEKLPDLDKNSTAYNDVLARRAQLLKEMLGLQEKMQSISSGYKVDFMSPAAFDKAKLDAAEKQQQRLEKLQQEKLLLDASLGTTTDAEALKRNYRLTQQLEREQGSLPGHLATSAQVASVASTAGVEVGEKHRYAKDFAGQIIDLGVWQMQWGVAGKINEVIGSFQQGISAAIEFDKEMTAVKWIMQANTAESDKLADSIYNLAGTFSYTPKELSDGLIILGQAGFKAIETMQMLPSVAALATATMSTLAQSTDILTTTIESFNLPTDNAKDIANTLAAITIESKLDMEKLGTSMNYVASTAATAGLSLEDTGTAMGLMANAGVRASTIGTSLRSVMGSLLAPTADFKNELAKIGLSMEDVNPMYHDFGEILQKLYAAGFDTEKAFASLDKRIANGIVVLMQQSGQWEEFQGRITGTQRAFTGAEAQMNTFEAQSKRLSSALRLFGTDLFLPATESGTRLLKVLGDIVSTGATAVHNLEGGEAGRAIRPLFGFAATAAGLTSLVSIIAALKTGVGSIWKEAKVAQSPSVLQRSFLSAGDTFFNPAMLRGSLITAGAVTAGIIGYEALSGKLEHDKAKSKLDYTSSTLADLETYSRQLKDAKPGSMTEIRVKEDINNFVDSISMFSEEVHAILAPLKDSTEDIDVAIARLRMLKADQAKVEFRTSLDEKFGVGARIFQQIWRVFRNPLDFENSFDKTDRERFNAQAEEIANQLKGQNKFYTSDELFNSTLDDALAQYGPVQEVSEVRRRLKAMYDEAMQEDDAPKKRFASATASLKTQMDAAEAANITMAKEQTTPRFKLDRSTGNWMPDNSVYAGAVSKAAEADKELKAASDEYLTAKAEATGDVYVYSLKNLRKTLDVASTKYEKMAAIVADSGSTEGEKSYAEDEMKTMLPNMVNKMRSYLLRSFYSSLGTSSALLKQADNVADVIAYGGADNAAALSAIPVSMRGDSMAKLGKLKDSYLQRWMSASDEIKKDPKFKEKLMLEYKLDITENLDEFRLKAAERATKYFKTYQEVMDDIAKTKTLKLNTQLDMSEGQRYDKLQDALLALRQGPSNLASSLTYREAGAYMPSKEYVPIAAYSKEQELLLELEATQASVRDAMTAKAAQYANEVENNERRLADLRKHYNDAYGGQISGAVAQNLNVEERKLLDERIKIQQDYQKTLQDLLKKEYDVRKQAAETIVDLERRKNESMAELSKRIKPDSDKSSSDLINDLTAAWQAMNDAGAKGNAKGVEDAIAKIKDFMDILAKAPDVSQSQLTGLRNGLFTRIKQDAGTAWDNTTSVAKGQLQASESAIAQIRSKRAAEWDKLMGKSASYGTITDMVTGKVSTIFDPGIKGTISEQQRLQFEAQGMTKEKYINAVDSMYVEPKTIQEAVKIASENLGTLATQFKSAAELFAELNEKMKGLKDGDKTMGYQDFKNTNSAPLQNLALKVDGQIKLIGADGKGVAMSEDQLKAVADRVSYELVRQLNGLGG